MNTVSAEVDQSLENDDNASGSSNMFENMAAIAVRVNRNESSGTVLSSYSYMDYGSHSSSNKNLQYSLANLNVFQNLPKETTKGVDDLTRMKMAILSGIPEEIKWALKKYLSYSNKAPYMISLKDLPDLLPLFKSFIVNIKDIIVNFDKPIADPKALTDIQLGLNSLLILRNLSQDTDSVHAMVTDDTIKEIVLFFLQQYEIYYITCEKQLYESNISIVTELIHYTLDIMEAISSYIAPAPLDDPFFQILINILNFSRDRYMLISILRSLSRLMVRSQADEPCAADNLDEKTLSLVISFLLVDCDTELISASLDLIYQYILPGNKRINKLISDQSRFNMLSTVLPNLLSNNIDLPNYSMIENFSVTLNKRLKPAAPKEAPPLDDHLFNELLTLEEPLRSTMWLRCCFEPIKDAEVTQIVLWKSYESKFAQPVRDLNGKKLLPAVEFIKNVSNAFHTASAMVITDPATGKKRFVIKGIQPKFKALSLREADEEHMKRVSNTEMGETDNSQNNSNTNASKSKKNNDDIIEPVMQNALPPIEFPNSLSEISKASASFLCLLSNDTAGNGVKFCQMIKPVVLQKLADIPPLSCALSEYMDNTKML